MSLACGGYHTVAITDKGEMYSWGWNHFGQLGLEGHEDIKVPTLVSALKKKKVVAVSCGEGHTTCIVVK